MDKLATAIPGNAAQDIPGVAWNSGFDARMYMGRGRESSSFAQRLAVGLRQYRVRKDALTPKYMTWGAP